MKTFNAAQRVISFVFVFSIVAYLFLNIRSQRFDIAYGLSLINPPASLSEYGEVTLEIDDALSDYTYRREDLINFYSYIQTRLGKEENGNFDFVRSTDGSLNYGDFYHEIPNALEEYALRVRRLKDFAKSDGCEVIFINAPPLYTDGYHTYTAGLHYQNQSIFMDAMLFFLQGFGVDCLDMRTALKTSGLEQSKLRYKTDAHWTIEASFEGFRALVRTLNDEYGENLDPDGIYTNPDNYTGTLYPDGLFGSLGMRAGLPFAGREDFTLLLPDFPTSFSHERNEVGEISLVDGDFNTAIIDGEYLLTDNMYMSYMGGLAAYRHIVNNNNADGIKVLFLSGSYSLPLAAFFATTAGEVDMIYTLSQEVFGYSVDVDEFLRENAQNYDYIFVELEPGSYSDSGFSFFGD